MTDLVLDAQERAIYESCGAGANALIHHSDRGTQEVSMRYTDRLAEADINPSVGSRGDSYRLCPRRVNPRPLQKRR